MPQYKVNIEREGAADADQSYTIYVEAPNANAAKAKAEASFIGGYNATKAEKQDTGEDDSPDAVTLTPAQVAELEARMDAEIEERANIKLTQALEDQDAEIERRVQERIAQLEEERASEKPDGPDDGQAPAAPTKTAAKK